MAPRATFFERAGSHARVAAAWRHAATATTSSLIAADGCFDVILAVDAEGRPSASLYTPVRAAHEVISAAGTTTLGIRVLPGHGGALALALPELLRVVEREVDVDALDRLEAIVAEALLGPEPPASVRELVAAARATAGGLHLGGTSSGAATRELQRACRRWVGLPPKAFLRIERAWAARRAILAGQPFADVAAELGYADQAHLTRELRALLGRTPRELWRVANLQDASPPNR